ncbi:hypothetical protein T05_4395 [Trichinella murrelli]|uniref:Uncharacterized protein n=1 Tax=Trichinella murrelli TaxID=144512 RepID=A0A0V0U958_9BILA|nr:hypothetical protein T05_4395 [Trichinella murrelli]
MTKCFKCCMFFANGYFNWKGPVLINYHIIKSYPEQKCLWQNVLQNLTIVRNCHIVKSSLLNVLFFQGKSSQFCLVFIEEKLFSAFLQQLMAYFSLNVSLIRHGPSFDFCVHKHSTGVISDDE